MKMVKLEVNLFSEPKVGEIYTITEFEQTEIQTRDGARDALRITLKPEDETDEVNYSVTLWLSDNAGLTSKLGSFVATLGNDTALWLNKKVKFVAWSQANREIEVV